MKRFAPIFAVLLLAPFLFSPVHTQVNSNLADVIAQLLDNPAPPPPPPKELAEALTAMNGSAINYRHGDYPDPGEDAPIKVLMAYWLTQARGRPANNLRRKSASDCCKPVRRSQNSPLTCSIFCRTPL